MGSGDAPLYTNNRLALIIICSEIESGGNLGLGKVTNIRNWKVDLHSIDFGWNLVLFFRISQVFFFFKTGCR